MFERCHPRRHRPLLARGLGSVGILRGVPIDPALVFEYATRTFWALLVVVVTLLFARVVRRTTMRALTRGRAQANVTILLGNLAQVAMLTIGTLLVLAIYTRDAFGWILTSFSVIGIVLGLSLQDILKNFFAGIWVLVERPFRIGDTIEVGGYSGVVEEITFRTTLLRTQDAQQVIVPNGTFMTGSVVNLTRFPTRRASVWLVIDDASKPIGADDVRAALRDASAVAKEPPPSVELRRVSDGKARYLVSFWTSERDSALSAAVAALRARFPQGEVHGD
jgi:small conductance mechanosensitive channel